MSTLCGCQLQSSALKAATVWFSNASECFHALHEVDINLQFFSFSLSNMNRGKHFYMTSAIFYFPVYLFVCITFDFIVSLFFQLVSLSFHVCPISCFSFFLNLYTLHVSLSYPSFLSSPRLLLLCFPYFTVFNVTRI